MVEVEANIEEQKEEVKVNTAQQPQRVKVVRDNDSNSAPGTREEQKNGVECASTPLPISLYKDIGLHKDDPEWNCRCA